MKRLTTFLMALMLTWIGANAQIDFTWAFNTGTWNGNTGTYDGGIERYGDEISVTGTESVKVLYETVSGLPAGEYTLTFYAVANNAWVGAAVGDNIAQVYVTANGTTKTEDVTVYDQTGCTLADYPHTFTVTVGSDGTLEFGLQNIATGGNWYIAQGVSLTNSNYVLTAGDKVYGCTAELSHWTTTGTTEIALNTWSEETDASGMVPPFCQNWVASGSTLTAATISHTQLTGLTAGYYEVSMDIRIFSEAGNEIGEGTTLAANDASVDLVAAGTADVYGTATEVYGKYTLTATVGDTGTLDISLIIPSSGVTYNWIAWKNLSVVYMGEELSYSIGEPQCAANCVRPSSTVSITFPNCITPNEGETPTLSTSASITVNSTAVTGTLSYSGTTATVTFTLPGTIGYGEAVTVVVPQGLLAWANSSPAVSSPTADVTFTLSTPAIADQSGVYLYSVNADQFMSRGGESTDILSTYGELAATDVYGIPLDITIGNDGFATIKFLDSQLYLYGGGWAWTDATEANAGKYAVKVVTTTDGETVYQFCYDDMEDTYLYVNVQSHNYVASNGNFNSDNNLQGDITRTYWQIFSIDERNAHKAARELNDHIAIAAADGGTVTSEAEFEAYLESIGITTDVTDMVANADLTNLSGWTYTSYNSGPQFFMKSSEKTYQTIIN